MASALFASYEDIFNQETVVKTAAALLIVSQKVDIMSTLYPT